ncbi:methyltransferase domain-containing protein [Ferrimonas balearica]|uniref:methyltransferase domain-containing protein n=1 Tax=Ferrimonas balearica TaxID=44012 RepID=UPI001C96505A|nr:methyltransferase domain-containing protein [Ferrimonas balearica]
MNDTNFDGRARKFADNIYGTSKGQVREAVLWHQLQHRFLPRLGQGDRVLDAGGGQGQMARRVAAAGYPVLLNDLSAEMLSMARQRADEAGLASRFQYQQGAIQQLPQQIAHPYQGVVCHAVLEWASDPQAVLAALAQCLAPGGVLSLAFFNHLGAEFHNLVAGNFDNLGEAMTNRKTRRVRMVPHSPLRNEQVIEWLETLGLQVEHQCGVRVIHDYLRDKSLQQSQLERLIELELAYCERVPYRDMGRYTHLLVSKPEQN